MSIGVVHRSNNFDAVRIIAALVVIFGHAHPLSAHPDDAILGNAVQSVAVKIFFVVSGFLVARSWESDPHPGRYLMRRGLRLLPGLALVLLLTTVVLGPIFTTLPVPAYFGHGGTWRYFVYNMVLYPIYSLPGVFADNIYPNAVNGSLWSLPAEVSMYLLLPVVFLTTVIDRSRRLLILTTCTLALLSLLYLSRSPADQQIVFWGTGSRSVADVGPYFFIGAMYSATSMKRWLSAPVSILLVGILALFQTPDYLLQQVGLMVVLPYAVLSFASEPIPVISRMGRFGDPSYGVYLYGFPVQQALFHLGGPAMGPLDNAIIATIITLLLGYASWHLLEKRALAFKPSRKKPVLKSPCKELPQS
ncbi:acyltransferase [Rhodanobacter caeni]|uniref:acyltransferase family protein n=1 Tax=Rhodanobacter caeni TaxID=657654 RepID=UPI0031E099EF